MGLPLFPGSAVDIAALPSGMGSFPWTFVEYKEQNGFVLRFRLARDQVQHRPLSESPLPCDCLLLLTGTLPGQLVVIERTPSRYAIRGPEDGYVCVTNAYQKLDADVGSSSSELLSTCCQRFQRIETLVNNRRPQNSDDCFGYLSDPDVRMHMTVQQMVFRAATGEHWIRFPQPTDPNQK